MTVALYSEGPLDLGTADLFADCNSAGPLAHLVDSTLEHPEGLYLEAWRLSRLHRADCPPGGDMLARRVKRALISARLDGYDAVVIVVDRDGERGADRLANMQAAREACGEGTVSSALGVARESMESWLMGDPGAWESVFGCKPASLPAKPEDWRYAKDLMHRCLADIGSGRGLEIYTRIAQQADWKALCKRCPLSFAPFAGELRTNLGGIYGAPLDLGE